MTKQQFLEKARHQHGYKYKYIDIREKITYKDYIKLELNDIIYIQKVSKHIEGKCPEKTTPKKTTENFIEESKKIWKDRFDYSETIYNGSTKKVKLFDRQYGMFITQLPNIHLYGHESKNINNDQFIEMSKLSSDFKYEYDKCEYLNKTTKVILICPEHGEFNVLPFNHLNYGEACKKCNTALMYKNIKKFLNDNKISFYQQHKFDDCKNIYPLPFDFYIPSMVALIDISNGGDESLKTNDKIKSDYCEENYIDLIRIKYDQFDDIYQILWNNLKFHIKRLKLS